MAGLLDMFPSDLNDPRAQFNLALAAGLLGGRGNFGQVFGQALPGALGAYNQAQESAQQRAMRQLQVDQLKRKMEQEQRDRDLLTKFASPQYPTGATSMRPETMNPLPFDPLAVLREGGSPEAAQTLAGLRAPKAPIKVGTEDTLLDPTTMKPVYQGSGKQSDFERALARVFPPGTPQYQRAMQDWITKQSTHQPPVALQMPSPVTYISGVGPSGKPEYFQAPTRAGEQPRPTGIQPAPKSERSLPVAAVNDLTAKRSEAEGIKRVLANFKKGFAGDRLDIIGEAKNFASRNFPLTDPERGQWWQDMQAIENQIRHGIFGSALTATEKASWEKTSVTPGMKPEVIEANLARRSEIIDRALQRMAKTYAAGGYPLEQIEEATGIPLTGGGATTDWSAEKSPDARGRGFRVLGKE